MIRLGAVVALCAAVLGGCASQTVKSPPRSDEPRSAQQIYLGDCAWCHGPDAEGTARGPAIRHGPASVDFMLSTGRMPLDEPDERLRRKEPFYSRSQIEAVADYVAALADGPEIPDVDPAAGDYAIGAELYLQNCAACHSATGSGGTLATTGETRTAFAPSTGEVPSVLEASAVEIAEAMLSGPGAMPVFGPETFDEQEVDSLVKYVLALQEEPDRGGASLGRIGPVTEGLVAWAVGILLLVVVIRWIGTRASE